jgi:threonine synthase
MMSMAPSRPERPAGDDHSFAHLPTAFACDGCGFRSPAAAPVPLRCPAAIPGDDIDHVMARTLDPGRLAFPTGTEPNPFVRYRSLFHAAHVASALGWSDAEYVALVDGLDEAVARIDGRGFAATPLLAADGLAARLSMDRAVLVKDETGNVSGSHKARHLMGTALELEVAEALERADPVRGGSVRPARLAIASCGNAALAAAVVARAWGRELHVFVPTDADRSVVERLRRLDAHVTIAPRVPGVPGDPTYRMLRHAIDDGAVPFTCQGNENGLAIEGGETLGYEIVSDLIDTGRRLDRLFIQVGGGALASSCGRALDDAHALGVLERLPRIHAVQSRGARPLVRAYDLVVDRLAHRLGLPVAAGTAGSRTPRQRSAAADRLREALAEPEGTAELARIAHHRSAFMWPWEEVPRSVAGGILDDETYDWYAVVRAMLRTGGFPVTAAEATLREANRVGRTTTGLDVDHTGTAGLAGLLQLRRAGLVDPGEAVAVLFTGVRRTARPGPRADPEPQHGA